MPTTVPTTRKKALRACSPELLAPMKVMKTAITAQ
jgi:hypothetical protein